MEPFETFEHAGCTIEIYQDESPQTPAEWDTLGTMYAVSRATEYQGFKSPSETHGQALEALERRGVAGMIRYLSFCHGVTAVAFDVFDHRTEASIREADSNDDNCSGYIAADAASIAMTGVDPADVLEGLRGELREWNALFAGEVVGYSIKDASGAGIGSCWSYYPDSGNLHPQASPEYRAFFETVPAHLRPYAHMLYEASMEAEAERDARQKAERQGIPTA